MISHQNLPLCWSSYCHSPLLFLYQPVFHRQSQRTRKVTPPAQLESKQPRLCVVYACAVRKRHSCRGDTRQSVARSVRRRSRPRGGTLSSPRSSGARSKVFKLGRARSRKLRHSRIGTRTAVSTPRNVTTCGPSVRLAFRNSLKRDLAS